MTIGRTDGSEHPFRATSFKAASLFGTGSRTPSGPAVMAPRQQAGHMIAIDPPVRLLNFALASEGPSTHGTEGARKTRSRPARYGFGQMRFSLIGIHQLRMTYSHPVV